MKSGSVLLLVCGGAAAASAGAWCVTHLLSSVLAGAPLGLRALVTVGVGTATTIGVFVPLALFGWRCAQRMCEAMEEAAEAGQHETVNVPFWLRPVAESLARVSEHWGERCGQLNTRLREIEIRHRVSEAEREHSEAILHSLRDAVLVTDAFNELTMANEPAAELLGFDLQAAGHRSVDDLVPDETLRQLIKEVRSSGVITKEKHFEHSLNIGSGEKGRSASFDVTLACLPGAKGEVGGVVTILRDITRDKEISQMKSDFVSQASHELRTPLSAINAYVEMLLDSEASDEKSRQEFYQIIKGEADRVTRMIDNMLNISRIEAGIVSVERSEVDFVKVCQEVAETMQPQAATKNIKISVKSGPLVYTAQADRDMMYQVVMNLVSNATKYTPDGGRVTVSVENDDTTRSVLVTVADTGLGIPPDALAKLFDKFFRIESYKRVAKGTGLGLNLVKHIVETVHRGKVGVSSEVGMGSKFWFTIPYEYEGR